MTDPERRAHLAVGASSRLVGMAAVLNSGTGEGRERHLRQLEAIVAHSPDPVIAVDTNLRVTELNLAAERMFGWSRAEMLKTDLLRLVPAEQQQQLIDVLGELAHGREVAAYETVRLHRDGSRQLVQVHPAALRERGEYVGAVATYRNLSARQQQERQLGNLLGAMPVVVAVFDAAGTVTYVVGGGYQGTGVTPSLAQGVKLLSPLPPPPRTPPGGVREAVREALAGGSSDIRVRFDNRLWQCHVGPLTDGDTALLGHDDVAPGGFLSAFDITSERQMTDRLGEVLAVSPICLATFDADGTISYAAGSGYAALGINPDDTVGLNMLTTYGDNLHIRDAIWTCLDGKPVDLVAEYSGRLWDLHYRPYPGADGSVSGGIAIAQDATHWLGVRLPDTDWTVGATTLSNASLPQPLAGFLEGDDVTGLLGRRGLQRRLSEPVPTGHVRALAVLDVDAFSLLNETYGTARADQALRALADRLKAHCGGGATLGRWHADEFFVILDVPEEAGADEQLESLTSSLLDVTREPLQVEDLVLHLGMSAGMTSSVLSPTGDLATAARQALRVAKQTGRDRYAWFHPEMARVTGGGMGLVNELRVGIRDQQLRLHYQPIVALDGNKIVGVEALVRWQHPVEGLLGPERFIEMAERTGLIAPLGAWVLAQSCQAAAELRGAGPPSVAVNLSARQLTDPALVNQVAEALEQAHCPASALVIEVTETAVMTEMAIAVATLEQLKDLGVQLALDDFGTGYSSLLYLKHFPIDKLKIDRSFVAGLGVNADDSAIVASTISLAHTMNITCIAEGIETIDQLALLTQMRCDAGQGYLFSRPLPLDTLNSWLTDHTSHPDQSEGRQLAVPPAEAGPDVTRILHMHADAASLHTIAAALNSEGRRTSRDTRWTAQSVARVIAHTQYPTLALRV